jgi:hypothetical protein
VTTEEVLRKIEECLGNAKIPQPQQPKEVEVAALKAPLNAKSRDSLTGIHLPSQLDDDFSDVGAVLPQGPKLGRRPETNSEDLARDLKKLCEDGAIKSRDDEALYQRLLITFSGRYLGKKEKDAEVKLAQPYKPTEGQIVKIPFGLSRAQQREFLECDLRMAFSD